MRFFRYFARLVGSHCRVHTVLLFSGLFGIFPTFLLKFRFHNDQVYDILSIFYGLLYHYHITDGLLVTDSIFLTLINSIYFSLAKASLASRPTLRAHRRTMRSLSRNTSPLERCLRIRFFPPTIPPSTCTAVDRNASSGCGRTRLWTIQSFSLAAPIGSM